MKIRVLSLLLVSVWLLAFTPGCFDESDACKAYCNEAAACLACGATSASLARCKSECEELSISDQKELPNCTKDCANYHSCRDLVGFVPPNPCDY